MKPTRMSTATEFPARLTDAEWAVLEPLVPANKPGGRPPKYTRRAIVDAIRHAVRQGNTWRATPPDLPHWNTALSLFITHGIYAHTTPCKSRPDFSEVGVTPRCLLFNPGNSADDLPTSHFPRLYTRLVH